MPPCCLHLALWIVCCAPTGETSQNRSIPTAATLDTGIVCREFSIDGGRLNTRAISNRVTGERQAVRGAEFRLQLMDGREISAEQYRVVGHQATAPAADVSESRLLFELEADDPGWPRIEAEYTARRGEHFLRKRLHFAMPAGASKVAIDWVDLEPLQLECPSRLGGLGQPVFWRDAWFAGIEHPAGVNEFRQGWLSCRHYPGRASFTSKWAVLGGLGMARATIEDEFQRYLATLLPPARSMLQYNSWYDLRDKDLTGERLQSALAHIKQKLLDPFELKLGALVLDDGWQNRQSFWQPKAALGGLVPLASEFKQNGSHLGLWLPLNGIGLDSAALGRQGYKLSDHSQAYCCLACAKYRHALHRVLEQRMAESDLAYLKHDFNYLQCSAAGHDHLPTARHGLEANVDAQLELLSHERRVRPEVFLNVTSNLWPSPWWLAHADTIWMGGADWEQDWTVPQGGGREAEMTYRDEQLFRLLKRTRAPLPLDRLMTHGIIRGRHGGEEPAETLAAWSDYVVWTLGRGSLLQELYLSPDRVPEAFWPVLGKALQWTHANRPVFQHSRMIGGRPAQGQAYGYLHWSDSKGIACLRNPSLTPASLTIDLGLRPCQLAQQARWYPLVVYPERRKLPAQDARHTLEVVLPAASIVVLELHAVLPDMFEGLPPGPFDVVPDAAGTHLVEYYEADFPPLRPVVEPEFDRKHWQAEFNYGSAEEGTSISLRLMQQPAEGARLQVMQHTAAVGVLSSLAPRGAGWSLSTYAIDPQVQQLHLDLWLPPSTFWPQRSIATAVLHQRKNLRVRKTSTSSPDQSVPAWPLLLHPGTAAHDTVLIDHKVLYRRRSRIESLGWVIVLFVVPLLGTQWMLRRLTAGRGPWVVGAAGCLSLVALTLLYGLTPLAAAVARALEG